MDKALKQRMVGAIVLIALGVIFIPMLLDGGTKEESRTVELDIPEPPERDYRSRLLPLEEGGEESASESRDRVSREPAPAVPADEGGTEPPRQAAAEPDPGPGPEASATEPEAPPAAATDAAGDEPPADSGSSGSGEAAGTQSREPGPLGNWFVQVGSFSRQSNAEDLRNRLRGAGYTAFVEASTVEGKTTHRVKVGPEMDRARSEKVRDEIQSEFDLKGIVVSEP